MHDPLCPRCGTTLLANGEDCAACSQYDFAFTAARSWARYGGELRQAILKMKRHRNEPLGRIFASNLAEVLRSQDWNPDLIVPIPLAPRRLAERGFNQVELLAAPLAEDLKIDLQPGALQRRLETQPQKGLTVHQRWDNLRTAFVADPAQMHGLTVVVIDDIMTTGATLSAAANVLNEAGAAAVYCLTLARTLLDDGLVR